MHYLVISTTPLFPDVSGNRNLILSTVRQIRAAGNRVSFLYSIQEDITNEGNRQMLREVDALYLCSYNGAVIRNEANSRALLRAALGEGGLNHELDAWYDDDVGELVRVIYERDPFDVILNNYIWMSKVFESVPAKVIKIQQTHDRMSDRMKMLAKQGISPAFFSVTPMDEGRALDRADINIAVQQGEEIYFRTLTRKLVCTIQNPITDIPFVPIRLPQGRRLRVGFVGSDTALNISTLKTFLDQLIQIPDLCNRIELCIAGHICRIFEKPLPFVTLLGPQRDLRQVYENMDVMINPMEDGTGLKIKSVEALQHHRPIVMTQIGGDGLFSPYHFHNCATVREVLGYLKMIADNPEILTPMQQAGEKVLNAYKYRMAQASRALLAPRDVLEEDARRKAKTRQVEFGGRTYTFVEPATTEQSVTDYAGIEALADLAPAGATWVDVGSRDGTFALLASNLFGVGKMILLECDTKRIEQIKLNVIGNKAQDVLDMRLLGFAAGQAQGYGHLAQKAGHRMACFDDGTEVLADDTIPFVPLDHVLSGEERVDVVSLAAGEPEAILAGMSQTLKRFRPLIVVEANARGAESLQAWAQKEGYALRRVGDSATGYLVLSPAASEVRKVG